MIHQFKQNGYSLVLDVYSGSIHLVDDLAYDVIALYETTPTGEITRRMLEQYKDDPEVTEESLSELYDDIETLRAQKKLFTEDAYANVAVDWKARKTEVKALCLHVAHTCNLNCSYCFAAQGKYNGPRALMSFETGKQALDFLIAKSGKRRNLEVDFFGGEPLMNWEVCKKLVEYARSREQETGKRFRFTLTTNGMLLDDEVTEFANREMHNVVLSLDGRREIHDALRKTPGGAGSYDEIVPRFQRFVEKRGGKNYYIRGTFTHRNAAFLPDLLHMADLGFSELSMEPVVCSPEDPAALTEEDFPTVCEQYEQLSTEMLRRHREGKGIHFYHYNLDLTGGPCLYKRLAGCGSGTEYLAVTPTGELYPCHQFVGDPAYRMGDVWQGVTNTALRDEFKGCSVYAREECKDCWAKLFCSGGCAANAYHASGSIRGTYEYGCRLFRKRIECALMLQVAMQQEAANKKETPV